MHQILVLRIKRVVDLEILAASYIQIAKDEYVTVEAPSVSVGVSAASVRDPRESNYSVAALEVCTGRIAPCRDDASTRERGSAALSVHTSTAKEEAYCFAANGGDAKPTK